MAGATPASLKTATDAMVARVQADIANLRSQLAALQNKPGLAPDDQAALDAAEAAIKALDPTDPTTLTDGGIDPGTLGTPGSSTPVAPGTPGTPVAPVATQPGTQPAGTQPVGTQPVGGAAVGTPDPLSTQTDQPVVLTGQGGTPTTTQAVPPPGAPGSTTPQR